MAYKLAVLLLIVCSVGLVSAQEMQIEIQVDSQTGTAYGLAWNPDGTILAVASGHELTLFTADLQTVLAMVTESVTGSAFIGAAWSPDGTQIATVSGYRHPDIQIWNWDEDAQELEHLTALEGANRSIEAAHRAQNQYGVFWGAAGLISLTDDRSSRFQIWDAAEEEMFHLQTSPYTSPLYHFVWSGDDSDIIAAGQESEGEDFVVYTIDVEDGDTKAVFRLPDRPWAVGISRYYHYVAAAYEDGTVDIIELASGETIHSFLSVGQPVAVGWNGEQLAILGYETDLQIWDLSAALEGFA